MRTFLYSSYIEVEIEWLLKTELTSRRESNNRRSLLRRGLGITTFIKISTQKKKISFSCILHKFLSIHLKGFIISMVTCYSRPLAPTFCSWVSRQSLVFQTKSCAGHPRFYWFRALDSLQFSLDNSLDFYSKITRLCPHNILGTENSSVS